MCEKILPPPSSDKAEAPRKRASRPGLYLRVEREDSDAYRKAMQYLAIFDGPTPLYILFEDTKKLKAAPAGKRVDINSVLLRELKTVLGEENVALRE